MIIKVDLDVIELNEIFANVKVASTASKEFHEKFYSYVEPISVTPFATKALDRYLAMYLAVIVRHSTHLELVNNNQANNDVEDKIGEIREIVRANILELLQNANSLNQYL
ncbi:MAG: hypothetical protein EOO92_09175, partial [Pedobacter sp.]